LAAAVVGPFSGDLTTLRPSFDRQPFGDTGRVGIEGVVGVIGLVLGLAVGLAVGLIGRGAGSLLRRCARLVVGLAGGSRVGGLLGLRRRGVGLVFESHAAGAQTEDTGGGDDGDGRAADTRIPHDGSAPLLVTGCTVAMCAVLLV